MAKTVRQIYGHPLIRDLPQNEQTRRAKEEAMKRAAEYGIEEIKKEIRRASWNNPPKDLIESFSYEIRASSILIKSDHPATEYVDKGVDPHQMTYLTESSRPVPILTRDGELIYRTPTEESMRGGKWQHPGFKGKHFLRRGIEKARERVKEELEKATKDILKAETRRKMSKNIRRLRNKLKK